MGFSRKFCGRVETDKAQSDVNNWIEQNTNLNIDLWALYNNPQTKEEIFNIYNINRLRLLLADYNVIQSQLVKINLIELKCRIVKKNLKNTRYQRSGKSFKVKKDLPKKA